MSEKHFTIDVEENTQENAVFLDGKFICFEDDTDALLNIMNVLYDEKESLKVLYDSHRNACEAFHNNVKETLLDHYKQLTKSSESGKLFVAPCRDRIIAIMNELGVKLDD